MFFKMSRILLSACLLAALVYGCDSSSDRHYETEVMVTESGKLAQVYVVDAMVIADKIAANNLGNFGLDAGERHAFSNESGDFHLEVPQNYGDYVLLSIGGVVTDSKGAKQPAIPMLAPKGAANITPVTTLVAAYPGLESKIGQDYDTDIASSNGVRWDIMQLAKSVETVLCILANKNDPIITDAGGQLAVVRKIAAELAFNDVLLTDDESVSDAFGNAVYLSLVDSTLNHDNDRRNQAEGLTAMITSAVDQVLAGIDNSGVVVEDTELLAKTEQIIASTMSGIGGTMLAFNPTASIIPLPNDLVWSTDAIPASRKGLVTFDPTTASDMTTAALYVAMNNLNIKGFSPNTLIGIPLTSDVKISSDSLANNIQLVDLKTLAGILYTALGIGDPTAVSADQVTAGVIGGLSQLDAAGWAGIQATLASAPYAAMIYEHDIKIVQDGNYIKIYPIKPLNPDSTYVVIIVDDKDDPTDDFVDVNGMPVKEPTMYKMLKSDTELTGAAAALEPLRQNYAILYNYFIKSLNMDKEDTLEIFTFTTAAKTLSLTDFAIMGAAIASGDISNLADMLTDGLDYTAITSEFGQMHGAADQFRMAMAGGVIPLPLVDNANSAFTSFDITSLANPSPTPVAVPFAVYNQTEYTDSVLIFQHGFGGMKSNGMGLTDVSLPIIAMDMPLHGDRAPEGLPSGYGFLNPNVGTDRVNMYQTLFDQTMMLKSIRDGQFDIDGDGTADTPDNVYFIGQSMGAITGAGFCGFNSELLDKMIFNVGGANFSIMLDQGTHKEVTDLIDAFNLTRNTPEYFGLLGMLQTLFDPADPVYLANSDFNSHPAFGEKTMLQAAYMDTFVPNAANEILATIVGHPISNRVQIIDFDGFSAGDNLSPNWYLYGGAPNKTDNWVKHGFLFDTTLDGYPEIPEGFLNQDYLMGAHNASHLQIKGYLE
ncbi:hypothetical protein QUF76_03915 [Desulfobacterales bacterium HSG16]|nr:hypothetical protein [Desulfobacterales bacterium HSG16]